MFYDFSELSLFVIHILLVSELVKSRQPFPFLIDIHLSAGVNPDRVLRLGFNALVFGRNLPAVYLDSAGACAGTAATDDFAGE
jgi:hypothetical protein